MSLPRLAAVALAAALLVATGAGASTCAATGPTSLHAFLLRADETARTSFPRTPAFAWDPVGGADHYEFQLSTSDTFRENALIWSASTLQGPVAAPTVSLPWITGSPHSLYARVRAVLDDGTVTPWSADYGFDVVPPPPPTPLPSSPGLLRWTPVEGADSYQVWLVDTGKVEPSYANVLDEREFYTFHQTAKWTGTVRWRVRALRTDLLGRANGVPVARYGAWSPIYVSTNTAMSGGQIHLGSTISDVVTHGATSDPAHKLMPGFTWSGNETLQGTPAELFRVYVFTDQQCLNQVFAGAVVGSPAYAGRPGGPLSLPTVDVTSARNSYLPDGSEPLGTTFDGYSVVTTESLPQAQPTTSVPVGKDTPTPASTGSSTSSSTSGGSSSGGGGLNWGNSQFGAPVDLWDTNWPSGGYYWTVVPVKAASPGAFQTTVAPPGGITGSSTIPVADSSGFAVGDQVQIGSAANTEPGVVTSVNANSINLATALKQAHGPGEPVVRVGGSIRYTDMELAQDACAAGRVARFGISSEPAVAGGGDAFASGLTTGGKLASALHTTTFYKQPLIAWTPALRAEAYEVQWSKTAYPFVPETDPAGGQPGIITASTSYILPVAPGTWYYRVRGFDYSLPTGAQQMGWSDVAKVVVGTPTFTVVSGDTGSASLPKAARGMRHYDKGSFSLSVPKTWREIKAKDSLYLFLARDAKARAGFHANVNVLQASGRGSRTSAQWLADLKAQAASLAIGPVTAQLVSEPAGKAALLSFVAKLKGGRLVAFRQYVFDGGSQAYVVTCSAAPASLPALATTFRTIAATFRIG